MHACVRSCSGPLGGLFGLLFTAWLTGAPFADAAPADRLQDGEAHATASLPRALRAAYLGAVQGDASAEYEARRAPSAQKIELANPGQGLDATLGAEGLRVRGEASGWQVALALRSHGCSGSPIAAAPALPRARGNRVEYDRAGLTEWYVNGPLGIEQGFTVPRRPGCPAAGGLVLSLELGAAAGADLVPALVDDGDGGQRIEVRDAGGRLVLGYSELYAVDAAGKALPATMSLSGRQLSLHIDDRAAQYPVTIDPLVWAQQAKLVPGDQGFGDLVGSAVALSVDTAIVGAPAKNQSGYSRSGAAYVFVRANGQWSQQSKIFASDVSSNAAFGASVALQGNTAIVGAPGAVSGATTGGAAYVYTRTGTVWTQQAKLIASDGATGDQFGASVGLSGTTAVVGAPKGKSATVTGCGALYVYSGSGANWGTGVKVNASDAVASDNYGASVAVDQGLIVVGAPNHTVTFTNAGQAYVVSFNGTTASEVAKLAAMDPATNDQLGRSVAISATTVVAGAPGKFSSTGAAYVFVGNGATYTQQQRITTSDGFSGDTLGTSVSILTDTVALGCPFCNVATFRDGATYVYTRSGTQWTQQAKLSVSFANGAGSSDNMGTAVAISADTVIAGAPNHSENFTSSGIGYAFFHGSADGDPCTQPGQCAGGYCTAGLCRSGKANGLSCISGSECGSSYCSDGVCCNTDCGQSNSNDCQACSLAAGAATNGVCGALGAGRSCVAGAGECKATFQCDGVSLACPAAVVQTDGQLCSVGVCMAGLCSPSAPPGYVPTPGSTASGCAVGAGHAPAQAAWWAMLVSLGVLGWLLARRRATRLP
jgi:uncharacterized protein (DUF2345 family)